MKRRFLFPGVPTVVVPGHAKSLHRTCPKCGQRMAWSPEWERDRWICVNCNAVHYEGQYEPNRDRFLQLIDGFAKLDAGEQVEVAADLGKTAKPEWKTVLMDIVRENQRPRILFLMLILLGLLLCAGIKALTTLPTFPEWMVNFTPFWFIVIVVPFLIVANITYIVPRRRRQMATNLLF